MRVRIPPPAPIPPLPRDEDFSLRTRTGKFESCVGHHLCGCLLVARMGPCQGLDWSSTLLNRSIFDGWRTRERGGLQSILRPVRFRRRRPHAPTCHRILRRESPEDRRLRCRTGAPSFTGRSTNGKSSGLHPENRGSSPRQSTNRARSLTDKRQSPKLKSCEFESRRAHHLDVAERRLRRSSKSVPCAFDSRRRDHLMFPCRPTAGRSALNRKIGVQISAREPTISPATTGAGPV